MSYHNANVPLDLVEGAETCGDVWPHDDPRWPKTCECGYVFAPDDAWQLFADRLYVRSDTGEETTLRDAPAGAMWYADWSLSDGSNWMRGPDGHCLMVRCPDGHTWCVDSEANNCTRKGDLSHKCWIRHGVPPDVHVDKAGETCSAGAGSIQTPSWHGFLTNGWLQEQR